MKRKLLLLIFTVYFIQISAQSVDDVFVDSGISYQILTTDTSNNVSVIGYDGSLGSDLIIPSEVVNNDVSYIVTAIGTNAFDDYFSDNFKITNNASTEYSNVPLTSVVMPNSITIIGANVFRSNDLTSLNIPDSVIEIGSQAFAYNNLTSVNIPASVIEIGYSAYLL